MNNGPEDKLKKTKAMNTPLTTIDPAAVEQAERLLRSEMADLHGRIEMAILDAGDEPAILEISEELMERVLKSAKLTLKDLEKVPYINYKGIFLTSAGNLDRVIDALHGARIEEGLGRNQITGS